MFDTDYASAAALAAPGAPPAAADDLPWVRLAPGRRYFETEAGEPYLVIGQNDALTWPELEGLLGRRDLPAVGRHLDYLRAHGVTTLRVMLEYVGDGLYLEEAPGRYNETTVRAIDDLVALCADRGLRLLLTPFDTYFMWVLWGEHPYSAGRGGPCARRLDLLLHGDGVAAVKARIAFAVRRWGGSGAVFAWDLWNELGHHHGVEAEAVDEPTAAKLTGVVAELSAHVRGIERREFGRSHLQTVSHFGAEPRGSLSSLIFRHPDLDFATTHVYEPGAIDAPGNTVAGAVAMGRWVRHALAEIADGRPYTDSETGPIHAYKDLGITLPEAFDLAYFRHMAWAHLASGGAGGGMRWPNRHPHTLTAGMRHAQGVMADFARLIDWRHFAAANASALARPSTPELVVFACADARQAVLWALRAGDELDAEGELPFRPMLAGARLSLPPMDPGDYRVTYVETHQGHVLGRSTLRLDGRPAELELPPVRHDLAIAVAPRG